MNTIGEIVKIYKGSKAENVFNDKRPKALSYLQIEDLRPNSKKKYTDDSNGFLVNEKDILIAWDGANAGTISFGLNGYIGSTLAALRLKNDNYDTAFIGRFLQSKFNFLRQNCTGATIPHISRNSLESLPLQIPKYDEQRRIAAILDKADRLRHQRHFAQTLSETFLDSVFNELFHNSDMNKWEFIELESLLKKKQNAIRTGPFGSQLLHSEFTKDGEISVLGIDNVVQNEFVWDKRRFITKEKYKELKRYTVFSNDLLISIMATCGRCAIVPRNVGIAINTKHLCCLTLDELKCLPVYLQSCFLRHPFVLNQLGVSGRGAIMPGLNMGIIKEIRIPLPPLPLQEKFAEIVKKFERVRRQQREAARQAEHLFQTLLHRAFRGEL